MAKRSIRTKQANRLRKAMRRTPPAYIDLVQWLKDRRYAQTTGAAEAIILDGRVRSDSHKLGITMGERIKKESRVKAVLRPQSLTKDDIESVEVVERFIPKERMKNVQVVA